MRSDSNFQIIQPGSISETIWNDKYRWKPSSGGDGDQSIDQTWNRVANALASVEVESGVWASRFYDVLRSFEFLPAGRIIAGAGTGRDVTMSNCFVSARINDSLAGIMKAVGDAALTLKAGGGIGMDFSTLRPRGSAVRGVDSVSSGAVAFMDLWHAMCGTIMSAGARRGAMMGILRIDHPDIEEFITAKREKGRLTNFNVSVAVTDAFMTAVKTDSMWALHFGGSEYKTLRARDLWEQITRLTYDYAEPGIVFIDRINDANPLAYAETLYATNPCGEQPLPPNGACLLGSLNLTQFVRDPFSPLAVVDIERLQHVTRLAVRMLDNVNDVSRYPLPEQRSEAQAKRRIGLGITGLADALIMRGYRYGSKVAADFASNLMEVISTAAEEASEGLGREKGSFSLFDQSRFAGGRFAHRRNSHLTSIAPTGTISLLAGNISSGIEPVFARSYKRKVLQPNGSHVEQVVEDYAVRLARHHGVPTSGDAWVTAADLTVDDHLRMVAAIQPYVDSAISKTINCPGNMPYEQFSAVYDRAYELGLKGCTTYRPSGVRGAVLEAIEPEKSAPTVSTLQPNVIQIGEPLSRPEMIKGRTYKLKPSGREHAHYITINDVEQHGRRRPFEMFISTKEVDGHEWKVALSRMISAVFRKGGDVAFVADELRQVHDPRGQGFWQNQQYVPSLCSAIGSIIDRHLRETGFVEPDEPTEQEAAPIMAARHCPKCQMGALIRSEGCDVCHSCGYSKCG